MLTLREDLKAQMLKGIEGNFHVTFMSIDYHEKMNTAWHFLLILALGVWQDC